MKKLSIVCLIFLLGSANLTFANEGMWLLHLLSGNYEEMKKLGLELTPEQIYNINQSSLKDAIVGLNKKNAKANFCTAEVISDKGLLLTNHHCAYGFIQEHSTTQNDYLKDGFWASSMENELPNPGYSASFLVRIENVTDKIMNGIQGLGPEEQYRKLEELKEQIAAEAKNGTHYDAFIKEFYNGNEFILFVMESFHDVRLVGAPPSSIGKFGGDTDNWMWPRHTGDFSMLRVYAGKDGKPADYSKENVPLRPKHSLPVALGGVEPGDFAMVMGFPGSTERYKTSFGLTFDFELRNPSTIRIREILLAKMKEDMDRSDAIRIKYASKYAQTSNYYKYFIGQNRGLERLGTIQQKKAEEAAFQKWANQSGNQNYITALAKIQRVYEETKGAQLIQNYFYEAIFGIEIMQQAYQLYSLEQLIKNSPDAKEDIKATAEEIRGSLNEFFKDYNLETDKKICYSMLQLYGKDLDKKARPELFNAIYEKSKGNLEKPVNAWYAKSFLPNKEKFNSFLDNPSLASLEKDPIYAQFSSFFNFFLENIAQTAGMADYVIDAAMKDYVAGLREMQKDRNFYPDANSTLRLTFGTVRPYNSQDQDGVSFNYMTSHKGILEKHNPKNPEFILPERLIELLNKKDFGSYAMGDKLPVCFITDNDITGGNSGSPVINGKGQLIGLAFDGNWEAMTGDLVYDPEYKRCICVDIRYVLYIVDKYAGATRLIEEMNLVK